MSDHVLFCSDLASRAASGNGVTFLQGWCFASLPVRGLALQNAASSYEPLAYGLERKDVGRAYPEYERASIAGFQLLTSLQISSVQSAALCLEVNKRDSTEPEYHVVWVNLDTRDVQTIELDEETRSRGAEVGRSLPAFIRSSALESRVRESLQKRGGLTLRLDLINKCNLRCIMCHFADDAVFRRPTKQLTALEFKNLFRDIGPFVGQVMLSCGDEPLLSKFLSEILFYLAVEHPHVAIQFCTNATLMNASIRQTIIETRVSLLLFSIDAVSTKLLESIRVGSRYVQVIGNILALRDLRAELGISYPAFVFNFVMMDRNIHEAPAFVHLAKALGAQAVDFRHMVIGNTFEHGTLLEHQPAKYNFYREAIATAAKQAGLDYYLPLAFDTTEKWKPTEEIALSLADFHQVTADPAGDNWPQVSRSATASDAADGGASTAEEFAGTFCPRPFSEIMVRDQEEVLPCAWHAKPLGYLRDGKSLSDIFFGEEFARVRRNMLKPEGDPNCARCPIKSGHLPNASNN